MSRPPAVRNSAERQAADTGCDLADPPARNRIELQRTSRTLWRVRANCPSLVPEGEVYVLSEAEVQRSFNLLFQGGKRGADLFQKAEELLDELRPESPLRLRLSNELDELRKLGQKLKGR